MPSCWALSDPARWLSGSVQGPLPLPVPPQSPVGKGAVCPFQLMARQETLKGAKSRFTFKARSFLTAKLG